MALILYLYKVKSLLYSLQLGNGGNHIQLLFVTNKLACINAMFIPSVSLNLVIQYLLGEHPFSWEIQAVKKYFSFISVYSR